MTKKETDRSLLRAFAMAAKVIPAYRDTYEPENVIGAVYRHHASKIQDATDRNLSRRQRVYARGVAHALATAWGL